MVARLEEMHCRDLRLVQTEIQHLTERLENDEIFWASLENQVHHLEQLQNAQTSHVSAKQLQLEEFDYRSRRHNLRFRGIQEAKGCDTLQTTVLAICQKLAVPAPPQALEFERIHRSLGPPSDFDGFSPPLF